MHVFLGWDGALLVNGPAICDGGGVKRSRCAVGQGSVATAAKMDLLHVEPVFVITKAIAAHP